MAGAGYKQFADGDVLTAAQVQTFLQDQAVMRFADSSARDAALGTAVAEGMVAYLDDTDELLVYDGAAWGGVGLALGTATPTDGQFLSFGTATSTWNPVDAPGNAGIGTNLQTIEGSVGFSSSSGSYTTDTQLGTLSFTPTSASSKVLVFYSLSRGYVIANGQAIFARIYADGSAISDEMVLTSSLSGDNMGGALVTLHSPATTSAVSYTVRVRTTTGTGQWLERQLTAIEVAA